MKKALITIFCLVLSTAVLPLFGQKLNDWKNLSVLEGHRDINLVIDYSGASICDEIFEDWVKGEPDWDVSFNEICSKFRKSFNMCSDKGKHPHRVGTFPNSDYKLVLHVTKVTSDGSRVRLVADVEDKEGNVIFSEKYGAQQGRWGSVANLMSDAFEVLGEKIGMGFKLHVK